MTTSDSEGVKDQGPLISIVTWFLLVVDFLSISLRLAIKWSVSRRLQLDDALAVFALVCLL